MRTDGRRDAERPRGAVLGPLALLLAAAGVVALEEMVDRLAEDHANAKQLARGLTSIPGISCNADVVETNILYYDVSGLPVAEFTARLRERGVLVGGNRMVTHYGITATDIADVLEVIRQIAAAPALSA